jgi:bifunctional DNA primase/polymerase-like protein
MNMIAQALTYAERGWAVLPLRGKVPRVDGGYKAAAKDPDTITKWWTGWRDADIGIRTGQESDVVVLDVDPRNGGDESLEALLEEHGPLPPTAEVATGGGGRHFYFSTPAESTDKLRKNLVPGLELLSEKAFVVAPPSLHKSGSEYSWAEGRNPSEVELAAVPVWLVELASRSQEPEPRSLAELLDEVGPIEADASAAEIQAMLQRASEIVHSGEIGEWYTLFRDAVVSRLKCAALISSPAKVFDEAIASVTEVGSDDSRSDGPEEISEELRETALTLLRRPQLLDLAAGAMDMLGLRGERHNRLLVFLSAVSGHLGAPIPIVVHGESSGGKNMLVRTSTMLLPESRVTFVSGLSEHALEYLGGRLEGVFVIDEAEGQKSAEYQLRVAMSEGRVTRLTVNKSESGRNEAQILEIEVAASIITTTTAPALHAENQTRVFDLWIDDSEQLTRKIIDAVASAAAGAEDHDTDAVLGLWRAAMWLLEPATVVIPYAGILGKHFPARPLRARRDFPRVLTLISACALFHQHQRGRDDKDRVVASGVDYRRAYPLIQTVLGPSMGGIAGKAIELCRLQKELEPKGGGWVRRIRLQNEAGRRGIASEATVQKWAERLRTMGIWEGVKEKGAWTHRTMRDPDETPIPLPTPDELEQNLVMMPETAIRGQEPSSDVWNGEGGSDV